MGNICGEQALAPQHWRQRRACIARTQYDGKASFVRAFRDRFFAQLDVAGIYRRSLM